MRTATPHFEHLPLWPPIVAFTTMRWPFEQKKAIFSAGGSEEAAAGAAAGGAGSDGAGSADGVSSFVQSIFALSSAMAITSFLCVLRTGPAPFSSV